MPFGDVRGNGDGSATHLRGEAESFIVRELVGTLVNQHRELDPFLPRLDISKCLNGHVVLSERMAERSSQPDWSRRHSTSGCTGNGEGGRRYRRRLTRDVQLPSPRSFPVPRSPFPVPRSGVENSFKRTGRQPFTTASRKRMVRRREWTPKLRVGAGAGRARELVVVVRDDEWLRSSLVAS